MTINASIHTYWQQEREAVERLLDHLANEEHVIHGVIGAGAREETTTNYQKPRHVIEATVQRLRASAVVWLENERKKNE